MVLSFNLVFFFNLTLNLLRRFFKTSFQLNLLRRFLLISTFNLSEPTQHSTTIIYFVTWVLSWRCEEMIVDVKHWHCPILPLTPRLEDPLWFLPATLTNLGNILLTFLEIKLAILIWNKLHFTYGVWHQIC